MLDGLPSRDVVNRKRIGNGNGKDVLWKDL